MRTLVVSDLHLGARGNRAVLHRPRWLEVLLEAVSDSDRLVLLGDLVEFRHGPPAPAIGAAKGVLARLGDALGAGRSVLIVPGNHDHRLLDPWLERRAASGGRLGVEAEADWSQGEALAELTEALAPAQAHVRYPGVWLRPDVYAIHGHYGDRHSTVPMLERLGAGLTALAVREPPTGPVAAEDYEAALAPMYAWIDAVARLRAGGAAQGPPGTSIRTWRALAAGARRGGMRSRALALGFRGAVAALNHTPLRPLRADASGEELRRAGLRACAESLRRLGVKADYVLFGHTHRAGPLPGDDLSEWRTSDGSRLLNTGSWLHEPAFLGRSPGQSPYRTGFAARLTDEGPPELVNLLDRRRL